MAYAMNSTISALCSVTVFVTGLVGCFVAAHEKISGQHYAKLSDDEIWSRVMKCMDRKELESLIDGIPMSMMAEQAWKISGEEPSFGNFVN